MNDLLLWMSVRGSGSEASFRQGARVHWQDDAAQVRRQSFRTAMWNLDKLGHAEFGTAAADAGWRIAPPVAAITNLGDSIVAIVCGARPPPLLDALASAPANIRCEIEGLTDGPDRIQLTAPSAPAMYAFAMSMGAVLQWNAPDALLTAQAPVRSTTFQPTSLPVSEEWETHRFSKSKKRWAEITKSEAGSLKAGLIRYRSERGTSYFLREGGESFGCPDVAVGKFRILPRRGRALSYNAASSELHFDAGCRPPSLVERALVIASGRLPAIQHDHLIYSGVSRGTAQRAAALLGQRLEDAIA